MHRFHYLCVPLLAALLGAPADAARELATPAAPIDQGTYTIYMENDLFAGTDRYYTSGVKLSWSSADLAKFSDTPYASPLLPLLNRLPFVNQEGFQKNLVFAFGQNIYTPDDTTSFELVENDRPYGGWLYVGVGLV